MRATGKREKSSRGGGGGGGGGQGSDNETNHGKTKVKLTEGFILPRTNAGSVCTAVESTQKQDLSLPKTL